MNLPNRLSLLRIIMVPFFVACCFIKLPYMPFVAVGIFLLAAFTDFLDGHIARKYNLVTDLGKLLDPIADKLLVTSALFVLVATNPFATVWGSILLSCGSAVIVGRELLVSAVRQIAAAKGVVIQANWWGKIKTIVQMIAVPLLLILGAFVGDSAIVASNIFVSVLTYGGLVLFSVAILLTIISGIIYIIDNRKVFGE